MLPTSELRNWRGGLTVSWREKVSPYLDPQSFPHMLFRAKVGGNWRTLESRSGRIEAEQTGHQEPHPRWADSVRAF